MARPLATLMTIRPMRIYLLAVTLIPLLGLWRLAGVSHLPSITILVASIADAMVLFLMLGTYRLATGYLREGSLGQRLNHHLNLAFAVLALVLLLVAELLYQRTGELLDLDVIRFALSNFVQLHGAINSALSWQDLNALLAVLLLAAVVLPNVSSRLIARLRVTLLIFPWCILSANAIFDAIVFDFAPISAPSGPYRGRYASLNTDYNEWFSDQKVAWKQGVLTGIVTGKIFTKFELEAMQQTELTSAAYSLPSQLAEPDKRYNILVIVLESIRHSAVGAYAGPVLNPSPTPFIDSVARDGWRVEHAYTTITHTSKALVGVYCGTFAQFSPLISESEPGGLPFNCLPKLLKPIGYSTAHFQTAPADFENRTGLLNNLGFEAQFTQSSYPGKSWQRFAYLAMDDRAMIGPAVSWMEEQQKAGKPFLASVLTVLTHHPYASPASNRPVSDPADAYAAYMAALTYTDKAMEDLFAGMKKAGLLENTLVVITGDHGEGFSEHGLLAHNGVGFEEGMRVPMILWGKMLGAPRIIGGLRQHLDLVPTVYDILGISPDSALPGTSLLQAKGHKQIITSCFYQDYCLNFYEQDAGKTMYFYGKRPPAYFDINLDPAETSDRLADFSAASVKQNISAALATKMQFERVYAVPPSTAKRSDRP